MDDTFDALSLAHAVAVRTADGDDEVGEHVETIVSDDGVSDFRFVSLKRGYEGWQWSVTLYHDEEADAWTVNESSLIPTDEALRPPTWIPWKDRLLPSDLSVTDALGTAEDDERLEPGLFPEADQGLGADSGHGDGQSGRRAVPDVRIAESTSGRDGEDSDETERNAEGTASQRDVVPSDEADGADATEGTVTSQNETSVGGNARSTADDGDHFVQQGADGRHDRDDEPEQGIDTQDGHGQDRGSDGGTDIADGETDLDQAVRRFDLSRRRVLSALGRSQTAERWYEGPRGPKALSTRTAGGNACSTCGFFVPLQGELGLMFGVCANRWSPDDARVVSLDHGCGEHSQIEPPEPSTMWVQSKPAYDNVNIDIVAPMPRSQRDDLDVLEGLDGIVQEVSASVGDDEPSSARTESDGTLRGRNDGGEGTDPEGLEEARVAGDGVVQVEGDPAGGEEPPAMPEDDATRGRSASRSRSSGRSRGRGSEGNAGKSAVDATHSAELEPPRPPRVVIPDVPARDVASGAADEASLVPAEEGALAHDGEDVTGNPDAGGDASRA